MIRPILKEPHPLLHRKAVTVTEVTQEIHRLIDAMIETMHAAQGVGLAANQVGSPWNILVASPDGQPGKELVLLNAVLTDRRGRGTSAEGCLSLPGISSSVTRSVRLTAKGLDREARPVTLQADGLLAKILQHEVDHLQGHLFIDRLGFWSRRRLLQTYHQLSKALSRVTV